MGVAAVFFHRVFYGPKLPQPEPVPVARVTRPEDEAGTKRREQP
jgi:hypothetical protein